VNEAKVYVGLDFARRTVQVAIQDAQGHALGRSQRLDNSGRGYEQFRELLRQAAEQAGVQRLVIGGEATGYYWLPFYQQLVSDPALGEMQLEPYLMNARWVHWRKKGHTPTHKDDPSDARAICDYVRTDPPGSLWGYDQAGLALRFLTRLRFHLSHSLTREKNLAQQYLFLLQPGYAVHRPLSDVFGATSRRLLGDEQALAELQAMSPQKRAEQLQTWSAGRLPNPQHVAAVFEQVFADQFPLPEALTQPLRDALGTQLTLIEALQKQIRHVEQHIAQQLQSGDYPQVGYLQSIPGIGPVLACGIAVEIGDLSRFTDPPEWDPVKRCPRKRTHAEVNDAVHKYAGLWWRHTQSGSFVGDLHPLSREGNPYLRYYVVEAAEMLRLHLPDFRSYYQAKFDQAHHNAHKRALVLTASKALDLFVTLLRRQEVYRAKEDRNPSAR
jgi:transposase